VRSNRLGALLSLLLCACANVHAKPVAADRAALIIDQAHFTTLYAIGDIHGDYHRLTALLLRHQIIVRLPTAPQAAEWAAANATLVVTGDMVDRGPQAPEVLEFLRALQADASAKGGRVVVTLGNHEAEFLAHPDNVAANRPLGFATELVAAQLSPTQVAAGRGALGQWLRALPLGARVGRWFFSHAGNSKGRTLAQLNEILSAGLARGGYADREITGKDSLLEARAWWEASTGTVTAACHALDVDHIVFGHTPDALGPTGAIATGAGGALFRIDVGMSENIGHSAGALLRVRCERGAQVATELSANGEQHELWRQAIPEQQLEGVSECGQN